MSLKTNSAMVERQILPWQMNSIFIIVFFSLFCLEMPCFARDSRIMVICSEITDCGKSEQDFASCNYLLVVKIVVKREGLLLRIFTTHNLHIQITYFQYFAQNVLSCYQTHNLQSLCDILHLYILLQI